MQALGVVLEGVASMGDDNEDMEVGQREGLLKVWEDKEVFCWDG